MIIEFFCSVTGTRFLERMLDEFRNAGHTVRVVNVLSDEDYRRKKSRLGQIWMRWLMYGWYPFKVTCYLIWVPVQPGTVRMTVTTPFYAPALVQMLSRWKRAPTMCLLYDVFPDALIVAGKIKPHSAVAKLLAAVTRYSIRSSSVTIYLGKRLMEHAEKAYGPSRARAVIPVGSDGEFLDSEPAPVCAGQRVRILYAGSMGHVHEIDTIAALFESTLPTEFEFHFHASGSNYSRLKERLIQMPKQPQNNISLGGPVLDGIWRGVMSEAHISLVTMCPGAEKVVFPSKAYSSLMAGHAILAICSRDSDLAELVLSHDCGWQVKPGNTQELRNILQSIQRDKAELNEKRRNAYTIGHRFFEMRTVAASYMALAKRILPS